MIPASPPPALADRELLERILRESGVERAVPGPSLLEYVQTISLAFLRWAFERMAPLAGLFEGRIVELVAWAIVVAATLALLGAALRRLARRARGRATAVPTAVPGPADDPGRDPAAFRAEVEAHLRGGEVAAALEALWWWLARSLAGPQVDPSWTSREMLARVGRLDLIPLVRDLDRMVYGADGPSVPEVRRLLVRLDQVVA